MYVSKILDEQGAVGGRCRVILEKPVSENTFIIKAVFRISNEKKAREMFNYLFHMRGPKATKPEAPTAKKNQKESDNGKIHEV